MADRIIIKAQDMSEVWNILEKDYPHLIEESKEVLSFGEVAPTYLDILWDLQDRAVVQIVIEKS